MHRESHAIPIVSRLSTVAARRLAATFYGAFHRRGSPRSTDRPRRSERTGKKERGGRRGSGKKEGKRDGRIPADAGNTIIHHSLFLGRTRPAALLEALTGVDRHNGIHGSQDPLKDDWLNWEPKPGSPGKTFFRFFSFLFLLYFFLSSSLSLFESF